MAGSLASISSRATQDDISPYSLLGRPIPHNAEVNSTGVITFRYGGKLLHIRIGRPYKNTRAIMPIDGLQVLVVEQGTGELIRELTLDPGRDYQGQK